MTQGHSLTFLAYESSPADTGEPTVTQVYPVRSDVLAVEIATGKVIYGQQVPYRPELEDQIQEADERGDRMVVKRDRARLGHLIGPSRDILYTFDQFVGSDLDPQWLDRPDSYRLTSTTDYCVRSSASASQSVSQKQAN